MSPPRRSPAADAALSSRTLGELVRREDARLEHAAIFIARDAHPQLVAGQVIESLDELAEGFELQNPESVEAHEQGVALCHHLGMRHGFAGNRKDYYDAENSYLDSVLARRRGIPITLAVVYVAVAERVGIPVAPVAFPGHFLARVGGEHGVLLDPFDGRVVSESELNLLLTRALGPNAALKPEHTASTDVAGVAQRMLLNLKRIHESRNDPARAMLVTDRLVEIAASPELRRDRGLFALKLGAHQVASTDLAHYLLKRPNAPDAKEIRNALSRSRKSAPAAN
jgi:regulator of sirC expression with transglutaminase-like and TPR domain